MKTLPVPATTQTAQTISCTLTIASQRLQVDLALPSTNIATFVVGFAAGVFAYNAIIEFLDE